RRSVTASSWCAPPRGVPSAPHSTVARAEVSMWPWAGARPEPSGASGRPHDSRVVGLYRTQPLLLVDEVSLLVGGRQRVGVGGRAREAGDLDESAQSAPEAADVGAGCCLDRRRALRRYPILVERLVRDHVASALRIADHQDQNRF